MNILDEARSDTGPKTPVRDAVRANLPEIVKALEIKASRAAIFRTLTRQGVFVGKNASSFNNALNDLEAEIAAIRAPRETDSTAATAAERPAAVDHFIDDRKPNAWGAA